MRLRFNTTRNVRRGGREGGPLLECRVSILRRAVSRPLSGLVVRSEWVNMYDISYLVASSKVDW